MNPDQLLINDPVGKQEITDLGAMISLDDNHRPI